MEFDYVIVGAGSAGCVIANRLSADGQSTVALLEAGPKDDYPWIHIPVGYFKTMGNPRTDWRFSTEKDPGLNGRAINWPRGRVLGGSSSINGLLYVRGQAEDFDHWRQLGNPGWGWDDVLPLFCRAETWEGGEDETRGGGGPLSVSSTTLSRPIVDAWMEAAVGLGYPANPDYNSGDQEGVAPYQLTVRNGRRCSTAVGYLRPAAGRSNLTVITDAQALGVEIAEGRARGVKVKRGGEEETVRARREVILSAGAVGSPHLLMLSGVGPAEELAAKGIDPRVDLQGVGRNLQDHLQARPVFKCRSSTINTETNNLFKKAAVAAQYALWRSGPMSMAASLGAAFLKTRPELATPDIQFHIQPFSADAPGQGTHPFDAFTTSVLQLRPESTGHIELKSPNPEDAPAIHPNYLATQTDRDTLVEGVRIARRIAAAKPLADLITAEHKPGPGVTDDFDEILDWARGSAVTIYHPTGTCKMGVDDMAVVDPRLKVRGVKGLRVADASIMPVITSGNTNAPAIMIGEKASDLILEDAAAA